MNGNQVIPLHGREFRPIDGHRGWVVTRRRRRTGRRITDV